MRGVRMPDFSAAGFRRKERVHKEGPEGKLGTPIFRLAWLLGDKRWVRTENTENTERTRRNKRKV